MRSVRGRISKVPIRVHTVTAYTYHHDRTWDYICRACMKEGVDSNMNWYTEKEGVFIECPRCKTKEKIGSVNYPIIGDPIIKLFKDYSLWR